MTLPAPRSSHLIQSQFDRLEDWCQLVRRMFRGSAAHGPFLVGSVLDSPDFRDVDLRLILPDAVFDRWWRDLVRVRLVNRAVSVWGQQETGLPIDFQVQRMTEANDQFNGRRNAMGIRDWETIPTSGVPKGRLGVSTLREALDDSARDVHALTVRHANFTCQGDFETCPSPYCTARRAALATPDRATPDTGELDVERLARAIAEHTHVGAPAEVIVACGRGHVDRCAPAIGREYAALRSEKP